MAQAIPNGTWRVRDDPGKGGRIDGDKKQKQSSVEVNTHSIQRRKAVNKIRIFTNLLFFSILVWNLPTAIGQSSFTQISIFDYDGVPINISNAQIRQSAVDGMRIYLNLENISGREIVAFNLWLLVYYENEKRPRLIKYDSTDEPIPAGQIRNIFWDEEEDNKTIVSALMVPYSVDMADLTNWRLQNFFAGQLGSGEANVLKPILYPELGAVTSFEDDNGMINRGTANELLEDQVLGVTRASGDSLEKIAQIRLVRTMPLQSGFTVDYLYPDKQIDVSDRVRLLTTGITRLNSTAKGFGIIGGVSLASAGVFHLLFRSDRDNLRDEDDSDEIAKLSKNIRDNKLRRDTALIAGGITIGSAVLSEFLWSHRGKYLHPPRYSLKPTHWNTTTRSFFTLSAAAFGAGLYYVQQRNHSEEILNNTFDQNVMQKYTGKLSAARNHRDASFVLAGTVFTAGILNQLLLGNSWDFSRPEGVSIITKKNPVSKSLLLLGGTAIGTAALFTIKKSQENENRKKAETLEEAEEFTRKVETNRKRRDIAFIIAGSAFVSSVATQIMFNRNPGDEFFDNALIPLPSLPRPAWYLAGLSAAGAGAALYFHDNVGYSRTRYDNATDTDEILRYREKIKDNEDRRSIALIASGASFGGAILSYFLFKKNDTGIPRIAGNNEESNAGSFSWSPHFDPIQSSFGLKISF